MPKQREHCLPTYVLSRAIGKFWSSMSSQNLGSQIKKKKSLAVYAHVNKVSKNEKKMKINVIRHDDRL
jgi:hypothetical protein